MLYIACAIIVKGNSILLVRKRSVWILPGGKIEKGETDTQCLFREICDEELPGLMIKSLRYFRNFHGITPYSKVRFCASVYFAEVEGEIYVGEEDSVSEAIVTDSPMILNLSDVTRRVVYSL